MTDTGLDKQLKHIKELQVNVPDLDIFLTNLHEKRKSQEDRRKGFFNGIAAGILVLLIGLFTAAQLTVNPSEIWVVDYFPEMIIDDDTDLLVYELAYYLVRESDDMILTINLLDQINFEPVNSMLEEMQ
ncbi:MAG: hypothetical protein V3S48_00970 [Candidatus Neomarinimicrobiota bacterium]